MWCLGYHGLESSNPSVDWRERYAESGELGECKDSTQLQFQTTSKLDLVSTLSSSTSKVSPVGSPAPPAKEHPDLHLWTRAKCDAEALDEFEAEDLITDEECSDMEIEYISLPKLKRDIRRADLTRDQMFLCCMP